MTDDELRQLMQETRDATAALETLVRAYVNELIELRKQKATLLRLLNRDVRGAFTYVVRVDGIDDVRQIRPSDIRRLFP